MDRDVAVRPAQVADAERIAEAHVRAWQSAYASLIPQDYLDGLDVQVRSQQWARVLSTHGMGASSRVTVGLAADEVCGFVAYGPSRDDDGGGGGELYALNVHPAAWGTGVAAALVEEAAEGLRELGFGEAHLWVVPGNARARRFYAKHGWKAQDVERTEEVQGVVVPEIRYHRTLSPS